MTTSQRPTEYFNGINYNSQFYNTPQYVTLEYATQNFLNRVGVANSVCSSTTFENALIANGGFSTTDISCSSINNTGDYTGSYLSLSNSIISAGYQAGQINQGLNAVAIGYQAGQNYQGINSVAIGLEAGSQTQGQAGIAIGYQSGKYTQALNSISIGTRAGFTGQNYNSVAIGYQAGSTNQNRDSVAIGFQAGNTNQGEGSIAIGYSSGENQQDNNSIAIGYQAGQTNQGLNSIAIGYQAGQTNQGQNSIAIGYQAKTTGSSCIAIGNNAISTGNNNVSIATTNDTINLNGDTTCKSLVSLSTQDANINNPTLGSIITNGGIMVSKNILGQNFQTDNNNDLNGIISKTNMGSNQLIGILDVTYNVYNISNTNLIGLQFYSMDTNSGLGSNIELTTPLTLRCISSIPRTGTTSTYYTFNVSVSNINLVVYKNSSYLSTQPMTLAQNNTSFNFTYQGTTNGTQTISFIMYMTYVYTTFILTPDTSNSTDTYDFYVSLDLAYTSVVTSPLTSGVTTFYVESNSAYSNYSKTQTGCSLSTSSSPGSSNPGANLYFYTKSPYDYGTSYTNILNCNNIKMLSTGIITKETINTNDDSTYQSYLTVRDCGVYLYNSSSTAILIAFPIYYTILQYSNFFTSAHTSTNLNLYNVSNSGGTGIGEYGGVNCANNDDAYLVYPDYGIQVYTGGNFGGTLVIDYYNSTSTLNTVRAVTNNTGNSCKIYYRGVEITSY